MVDTVSPEVRSKIMRSIKDPSQLELRARPWIEKLYGKSLKHHVQPPGYPYMPDYYSPHTRTVIFVNGCWWHGCPEHYKPPSTRNSYWENKIATNKTRDRNAWSAALYMGLRVQVIWEHQFGKPNVLSEPDGKAPKGPDLARAECIRFKTKTDILGPLRAHENFLEREVETSQPQFLAATKTELRAVSSIIARVEHMDEC